MNDILSLTTVHPTAIDEFIDLLKIHLDTNICKFDNEFHKFPDGLPMGSPITPVLAEICMT